VFELPGVLGGLNPPSYFIDPPNTEPDFVLGGGVSTYSTRTIYTAVWKYSDSQKNSTPSYFSTIQTLVTTYHRRRRRGGAGGTCAAPSFQKKIRKKYFLGNYYVKFGHFSGKNRVKLRNFVNFSGKYHKNSGMLIIFRVKII